MAVVKTLVHLHEFPRHHSQWQSAKRCSSEISSFNGSAPHGVAQRDEASGKKAAL
jgi:hypothetical protein